MQELIKIIKGFGIPVVVILAVWLAISVYKAHMQIKFYELNIKKLKRDLQIPNNGD